MLKLSTKIAFRYFISPKSHSAVNIISGVSAASVAVATAAIVIVLSVFNGFSNLTRNRFSEIDAELTVIPKQGKVFTQADSLSLIAKGVAGVDAAVPSLTERGLIIASDNSQLGVIFKGVGDNYDEIVDIESITDYKFIRPEYDTLPPAELSIGVASRLALRPGQPFELITLRRVGRINPANPSGAFLSQKLSGNRIISVDQMEFDADNIIIPIDIARDLLQYENREASAIEISLRPGVSAGEVAQELEKTFPDMKILRREQLHGESYRMIAVEKWITFAMLIFILLIATFNIISTMSLMIIEKRDNMSTLRFLGATRQQVRQIFAIMGALITIIGGAAGIILGIALSLAQQWGGFIKLGGNEAYLTITEYPVHVEATDILAVFALLVVVSLLSSMTARLWRENDSQ